MAAGDKEIVQAFEETIRRNVETLAAFSNETREIVRKLEERVRRAEDQVMSRNTDIQQLRLMLANLQAQAFAGGTPESE